MLFQGYSELFKSGLRYVTENEWNPWALIDLIEEKGFPVSDRLFRNIKVFRDQIFIVSFEGFDLVVRFEFGFYTLNIEPCVGIIPDSLSGVHELSYYNDKFVIYENMKAGSIHDISFMKGSPHVLEYFNFREHSDRDLIALGFTFSNLVSMSLDVKSASFGDIVPELACVNLKYFWCNAFINDEWLIEILKLPNLDEVTVCAARLTNASIEAILGNTKLSRFTVYDKSGQGKKFFEFLWQSVKTSRTKLIV